MGRRRVVLLNPPAERRVSRDYFLGVESPPGWSLPPLDLASLSGALEGLDVAVVDAPAEGFDARAAHAAVVEARPDDVIFLTAGATFTRDTAFLSGLDAALPRARFAGLGDVYADVRSLAFGLQPFLDAVLLDFAGPHAADWVRGELEGASNVIVRGPDGRPRALPARGARGVWRPRPARWELFPLARYAFPGSRGPCGSLLTE
jgi:hypothetical protein